MLYGQGARPLDLRANDRSLIQPFSKSSSVAVKCPCIWSCPKALMQIIDPTLIDLMLIDPLQSARRCNSKPLPPPGAHSHAQ